MSRDGPQVPAPVSGCFCARDEGPAIRHEPAETSVGRWVLWELRRTGDSTPERSSSTAAGCHRMLDEPRGTLPQAGRGAAQLSALGAQPVGRRAPSVASPARRLDTALGSCEPPPKADDEVGARSDVFAHGRAARRRSGTPSTSIIPVGSGLRRSRSGAPSGSAAGGWRAAPDAAASVGELAYPVVGADVLRHSSTDWAQSPVRHAAPGVHPARQSCALRSPSTRLWLEP
jgi:hypothetical protein